MARRVFPRLLPVAAALAGLHASPLLAQSTDGSAAPAVVQPLSRFQAEQERLRKLLESRPKAYEDRFLDSSVAPAPADDAAPGAADVTGFRGYMIETRMDLVRSDSGLALRSTRDLGVSTEYRHETLNYGDFMFQLDARNGNGDLAGIPGLRGPVTDQTSSRITLRNVGLPVTTRLFADTSLGDINSEVTDALARAYRLSLGTGVVRGAATHLFNDTMDLRLGMGQRGALAGGPYPGFHRSNGTLAWAGYSQRLTDSSYAGAQLSRATGLFPALFTLVPESAHGVTSGAAAIGTSGEWRGVGSYKSRLTLVTSKVEGGLAGDRPRANGLFVEASLQSGRQRHEFGLYKADPNLRFGDNPLLADNRGAYWRMDASSLRSSWGLGLIVEDSNPSLEPGRPAERSYSASANGRHRFGRDDSIGGNLTWAQSRRRHAATPGNAGEGNRSINAGLFYENRPFTALGPSRIRLTLHRNEVLVANDIAATGEEIEFEQDWIAGRFETLRPEFVTTLGIARDRSTGETETRPTAGVTFRLWPGPDWNLGGSLRYTARRGNLATSRGLSGTIDSEKVFPQGWRLGANISLNQAVVNQGPIGQAGPQVIRGSDRSASVYLHWEGASGTPYQAAGLRGPGSPGGGSLDGVVYFDANRDGEQQAGESGVPGVEVFLDGRYRVTTDRSGRFVFALVGSGPHQLTLSAESVPLPWGPAPDRILRVEVPLRGQASARIPVVRTGD